MSTGREVSQRSTFERITEAFGTGVGGTIGWLAEHRVLFALYAAIWVLAGAGLVVNEAAVVQAWTLIGTQNILVQAVLWLLFLPVMLGLWIWHTDWPLLARALLVIALASWNLVVLIPRRGAQSAQPQDGGAATTGG